MWRGWPPVVQLSIYTGIFLRITQSNSAKNTCFLYCKCEKGDNWDECLPLGDDTYIHVIFKKYIYNFIYIVCFEKNQKYKELLPTGFYGNRSNKLRIFNFLILKHFYYFAKKLPWITCWTNLRLDEGFSKTPLWPTKSGLEDSR
jgi:hypothetical protein